MSSFHYTLSCSLIPILDTHGRASENTLYERPLIMRDHYTHYERRIQIKKKKRRLVMIRPVSKSEIS